MKGKDKAPKVKRDKYIVIVPYGDIRVKEFDNEKEVNKFLRNNLIYNARILKGEDVTQLLRRLG